MNAMKQSHYPERWLILSPDVFETIKSEPTDDDSLYKLRLDAKLVALADFGTLKDRLQVLAEVGVSAIHLVVEELDAETMELLQPLASDDVDIQLHDFFESPSAVLMSLSAPDQAVVDALRSAAPGQGDAILELLAPSDLSADFALRYIAALPRWEEAAREDWPEEFGGCYPAYEVNRINWARVVAPVQVVEAAPELARFGEVTDAALAFAQGAIVFAGLWTIGKAAVALRRTAEAGQRPLAFGTAGGLHAAGAHAADEVKWSVQGGDVRATIRVTFSAVGERQAVAVVEWPTDEQLPDLLTLDFAEHDFKLSIRPGSWMQSGSCQWGTCQLPDPLGALRSWLHHLAAIEAVPTWTANRNGPGPSQSS